MIHLTSVDTEDQANEIEACFEASGIPVFLQEDFTRLDPTNRLANYGYRVHIWLDEQLEDAKQLLKDASYEVKHPVNVAEFYASLDRQDEEREVAWYKSEEKWLNGLFALVAAGLIGWMAYAVAS